MTKSIAQALLDIKAVSLSPNDPFTWSSGIKSPIYCDNRITLGFPDVRTHIRDGLQALIETHFKDIEVISGTATAGIPHAAYVSEVMNLPMNYVRSKAKVMVNRIKLKVHQVKVKCSSYRRFNIYRWLFNNCSRCTKSCRCKCIRSSSNLYLWFEKADDQFARADIPFYTLSNYNELIEVARENGEISENDITTLVDWRDNLS